MEIGFALFSYFRKHREAIRRELDSADGLRLRLRLDLFESYWRGAQPLLRKPASELCADDAERVRRDLYSLLAVMANALPGTPIESVTHGLYQVEAAWTKGERLAFFDDYLKEASHYWYWADAHGRTPGRTFNYEWKGVGVERMLALELWRENACRQHALYFSMPEAQKTLGAEMAAIESAWQAMCAQMDDVLLSDKNWPSLADIGVTPREVARSIADAMFAGLGRKQLTLLRGNDEVVIDALHRALGVKK